MKNFFRNNDFSQFFYKTSISVVKYKDCELTDIELNTKFVFSKKYFQVMKLN